ncbi:transcriptional regulator, Crp/Fnr family [hydrothermal vent metagenome]|uniref:Transcriptional regulator, Crp/Fnr family n=1 Tax=hydrothermal vent metagenome TaxID=652676 RepID=A0A3B0YSY3_9ZZZZ
MRSIATDTLTDKPEPGGFSEKLQELDKCYAGFVSGCDAPALELLEQTDHVQLPAGTVMFRESDPCQNFLWLLEGCVRVYKHSSDGREVSLYRVEPGELCVLSLNALLGGRPYPAEALAETDVTGLMISGKRLLAGIDESISLRRHVMKMLSDRLYETMSLISDIAFHRLDLRLACLLGQRFERSGGEPLSVTHAQLARELGTTREVISRILKEFEHQECVKLARGRIYLVSRQGLNWFTQES